MSSYRFRAWGHKNILGTHKTTFEFTKDRELTPKGDCIIGVNSDFSSSQIVGRFKRKVTITLSIGRIAEKITADFNPRFSSDHEIVVRMGSFDSERTLGVNSSKGSIMIDRRLIERLKNPETCMMVEISDEEETAEQIRHQGLQ